MSGFVGAALALLVILQAMRVARTQGIPLLPFLGWSLSIAALAGAMVVGGTFCAMKVFHREAAQLTVVFLTIAACVAISIWLSRIAWRRLRQQAARPNPR